MSDLRMILADESEIELAEFTLPMHAVVVCNSEKSVVETWNRLSTENLASIKIMSEDDQVYAFSDGRLSGVQTVIAANGTHTTHFYMEGNRASTEYEQAAKILLGEEG